MLKKVAIGILAMLNILMLFALWQSRPNTATNQSQKAKIEQNKRQINNLKKKTDQLTTKSVVLGVEKDAVDINITKNKANKVINDSFNAVYNNAKNEEDLKNLKKNLPRVAGQPLAHALLATDHLQLNDQGQRVLSYTKLNDVKISYGTYNISTGDLPITAIVDYQGLSSSGHALWKINYNAHSNQITSAQVTPMNK